jgi:hypothetical protein
MTGAERGIPAGPARAIPRIGGAPTFPNASSNRRHFPTRVLTTARVEVLRHLSRNTLRGVAAVFLEETYMTTRTRGLQAIRGLRPIRRGPGEGRPNRSTIEHGSDRAITMAVIYQAARMT